MKEAPTALLTIQVLEALREAAGLKTLEQAERTLVARIPRRHRESFLESLKAFQGEP